MKHPGKTVEAKILELIRRRDQFQQFTRIINADFFSNAASRRVFDEISRIYSEHSIPIIKYADILASIKVRESDDDVVKEVVSLLGVMKSLGAIDVSVVRGIAIDWSKRSLVKLALYEGLDQLDRGNGLDLGSIRSRLDAAATLDVDEAQEYGYLAGTRDRLNHDPMVAPIETGISEIDDLIQGGLDCGELGLFIGPTHRGKTRALINIGARALVRGKHVAHIIVADSTTKRIARRYDSILCNKRYAVLRDDPSILKQKLREVHKAGGKLVIKEYDKISPTPNDIRHWLKGYVDKSPRKLDLIILDYLDELRSERAYKDYRYESKETAAAIRRLGAEFNVPVWTASQGNRESMNKRIVGMDSIAEDIQRANKADVIITLNQTDEERADKVIRYHVPKARREDFTPATFTLEISDAGYISLAGWNS